MRVPSVQVDHVLVPLDGTDFALRAMRTAIELARMFDAQLHTFSLAVSQEESERLVATIPASLRRYPGGKHVRVEVGGDPAEAIARRAKELGSSVVCLTTRSRGRFDGAVMGSVARSVIERSGVPTIALGPIADNSGWSPPPRSWPKPISVPRLVACVDGTQTSEEILPVAVGWSLALGMSLTILTVVDDNPAGWSDERQSRFGPNAEPDSYLDALVKLWGEVHPAIDGEVVRDPISPARGVKDHLGKRPAGLVALTTHARSGMNRVRFGARAAAIVRTSVVPCLVAPVGDFATR